MMFDILKYLNYSCTVVLGKFNFRHKPGVNSQATFFFLFPPFFFIQCRLGIAKRSQLCFFFPYATVYCYLEFKLRYLEKPKLFTIIVKKTFKPIALWKMGDRFLHFLMKLCKMSWRKTILFCSFLIFWIIHIIPHVTRDSTKRRGKTKRSPKKS